MQKGEWKSALGEDGALFAMIPGMTQQLRWFATNWDTPQNVIGAASEYSGSFATL